MAGIARILNQVLGSRRRGTGVGTTGVTTPPAGGGLGGAPVGGAGAGGAGARGLRSLLRRFR